MGGVIGQENSLTSPASLNQLAYMWPDLLAARRRGTGKTSPSVNRTSTLCPGASVTPEASAPVPQVERSTLARRPDCR